MAEPIDSETHHESAEKIGLVAGALAAGRSLLDRPPSPVPVNLAELARSLSDENRRAQAIDTTRSTIADKSSIPLDSTRLDLPGSAVSANAKEGKASPEEIHRSNSISDQRGKSSSSREEPAREDRSKPPPSLALKNLPAAAPVAFAADQGSTPTIIPETKGAIEPIFRTSGHSEAAKVTPTWPTAAPQTGIESGGARETGGVVEPEQRYHPGLALVASVRSDPIQANDPVRSIDRAETRVAPRVSAVSTIGELDRGQGVSPPESRSSANPVAAMARSGFSSPLIEPVLGSPKSDQPLMTFVRNPLSSGFADFSESSQGSPAPGESAPGQAGFGQGAGFSSTGGASSPQAGTSTDLSRTNELLQQLLDAVRKQQVSYLPSGGPSVYPDR